MSETTTETKTDETAKNNGQDLKTRFELFQTRAKNEWATAEAKARAELQAFPAKLKTSASQAFEKLRSGLDLPSRGEVAALAARIEELAGKLAEYESQNVSRGSKKNHTKES
jgi:hypothetical protein